MFLAQIINNHKKYRKEIMGGTVRVRINLWRGYSIVLTY